MQEDLFSAAIKTIRERDPRYAADAYGFIRQGLDFTSKLLEKPVDGPQRHVSGAELLDGLRRYARQEFGPMARTVLASWGIARTEDFGEIVFNLVESGVLGKTESDSRADFGGGYDFDEAFVEPYLPASAHHGDPPPEPKAAGRAPRRPRQPPPNP